VPLGEYATQTSLDFGTHLEQFCSWYFEDAKKMGKVIKIEIPLFPTPNGNHEARSQFAVYVKSDKTADESKIDRLLSLGNRQKSPCRISWMGASPFCNYCKGHGHLLLHCPKRLAIVCSACNANGHVSFTCSRFSARDVKRAKGSGRMEPIKLSAYADDLMTLISSTTEWSALEDTLQTYGPAFNAKVNLSKTVAFPMAPSYSKEL
ncbi:hypothetical protein EC957_012185, partial [Mortierella hygrophila]